MLIDTFMPTYDAVEHHEIEVRAPIRRVYGAIKSAHLFESAVTRGLFFLRSLPARLRFRGERPSAPQVTIDTLLQRGFILLADDPPRELVLGLVEKFWAAAGVPQRLDAQGFAAFDLPGFAKAVANFCVEEQAEGVSRLTTETRVLCLDEGSRRRFRVYWFFIAPFSGLIRRQMLRAIRQTAERAALKER